MTVNSNRTRQNWLFAWLWWPCAPRTICAAAHGGTPILAAYGLIGGAANSRCHPRLCGAIRWGLAMRDGRHVLVVLLVGHAALLAWSAVNLLDVRLSVLALSLSTLALSVDRQAFQRGLLPA